MKIIDGIKVYESLLDFAAAAMAKELPKYREVYVCGKTANDRRAYGMTNIEWDVESDQGSICTCWKQEYAVKIAILFSKTKEWRP